MASGHLESSNHGRPLAQEITAATRSVHAGLNKQIVARLPLALPPHATDPTPYVTGLLHIAPIYLTFESLWRDITELPPFESDAELQESTDALPCNTGAAAEGRGPPPRAESRVHALLNDLYLPDLMRSSRLKEDIGVLTGWTRDVVEEQLDAVAQTGRLSEFLGHIRRAVQQKPHILLAYSYIMFMALFAGGRFIRASLASVGDEFWALGTSVTKLPLPKRDSFSNTTSLGSTKHDPRDSHNGAEFSGAHHDSPFCFFHFSTPNDGEDLKLEFKSRLIRAEKMLTEREKREVVQEAVCIFDNMLLLVQQLDTAFAGSTQADVDVDGSMAGLGQLFKNPLAARFRDSVAVTRERAARSSTKWLSGTGDVNEPIPDTTSLGLSHPSILGLAPGQLCPAMAKSMRFDKTSASPHALRLQKSSEELRVNLAGGAKRAARGVNDIGVTNLAVAFALGAVFVCALFYGRSIHTF